MAADRLQHGVDLIEIDFDQSRPEPVAGESASRDPPADCCDVDTGVFGSTIETVEPTLLRTVRLGHA